MNNLKSKVEDKNTQLVKVNALNEISFLKDIEKTPSFLVYNKKKNRFLAVDTSITQNDNIDYENSEELCEHLAKRIQNSLKQL